MFDNKKNAFKIAKFVKIAFDKNEIYDEL